MKSEKRLDSVVFQLTPTRTRCDLVIISDKKTEKIASGLFSPFLAHLKTAQEQIDKGGYSITLQPDPDRDASWFTKGTVERFVRFVSTPEILERVNTIESEILQIEEAIAIQGNDSLGLTTLEFHQKLSIENVEGGKPVGGNDADKAIVLYKPGTDPPQINGSTVETENSKVQLMRVLETRRTVLRKEQGMAFARALAAGFDMDQMVNLVSFSECFGAARLLAACVKFIELWRGKHENGQWFEMEATEAMPTRSDISPLNVSGIVLSGSNGERNTEGNDKDTNDDKSAPGNPHVMLGPHDYPQGQFQHCMFPQWPINSPHGAAVFQSYPLQGMPRYPNYPGNSPFHSPYNQVEDPRLNTRRMKKKKHSMDNKESSSDSDAGDMGVSNRRSPNGSDTEGSEGKAHNKKTSRSGKMRSGVVIRNINYIASKKHSASGSDQEADYGSGMEEGIDIPHRHGKERSRSQKGQSSMVEPVNFSEEGIQKQDTDSGNWQAFQSFLLRNEDNASSASDKIMFSNEKETLVKRGLSNGDPILNPGRGLNDNADDRMIDFNSADGRMVRSTQMSPEDYFISSNGQLMPKANQANVKLSETEGGRAGYRQHNSDDFFIYGREKQPNGRNSLDPLAEDHVHSDKNPCHNINDESYVVPFRSHSQDPIATSRDAIDADMVFQTNSQKMDASTDKIRNPASYEPNDLCLIHDRDIISEPTGSDPAIYYNMDNHIQTTGRSNDTHDDMSHGTVKGMGPHKEKKIQASQSGLAKKKAEPVRRGKPSKLNPLAEAQARAEKLRAFKADLQKTKKEKEDEEIKRLEALKRERQRRIAARGGTSSSVQRGTTPLQNRSQVPAKFSPNLHRVSKFSDTEPSSMSPLQKISIRRASTGSGIPQKVTAASKLASDNSSRNGLSRSASSLPEIKKERNATNDKKSIPVTRRLSDPRGGVIYHSSLKSSNTIQVSKASTPDSRGNNTARPASLKSRTIDRIEKNNMSDEPQVKKISAIINLDKSKAATLPELKLRTQTAHIGMLQAKTNKRSLEQNKMDQLSLTPESIKGKSAMEGTSQSAYVDEHLVIEKTVVTMEHESLPVPAISHEILKMAGLARKDAEIEGGHKGPCNHPPTTVTIPMRDPVNGLSPCQPSSYEVVKDDIQKLSNSIHAEKPYKAPHARLSSMESLSDLDHSGALPMTSEMGKTGADGTHRHISNSMAPTSSEQMLDLRGKPPSKEPKGFKRLLKFGKRRQNSSSEECSMDPGGSSTDSHVASHISSNEVPSLKHLISEEDSHTGGASKASRSFSILSPFRIKSGEKKIAA